MRRLFPPKLRVEADSPVRLSNPDVPVIFTAPVVTVRPLEAVSNPFEVIVPPVLVDMFPLVERTPFSFIVSFDTPADWISREVLVAALVSFRTKAVAAPAFVKENDVETPRPDARVKSMFRPVVVTMVLPPSYAV